MERWINEADKDSLLSSDTVRLAWTLIAIWRIAWRQHWAITFVPFVVGLNNAGRRIGTYCEKPDL